jgi:hypothetical protein
MSTGECLSVLWHVSYDHAGVPQLVPLIVESKNIHTAPGVSLTSEQEEIVGSVLDLFAGRPSLPKLALWREDATFSDPVTVATGRAKYSAHWYALERFFREIEQVQHMVVDAGDPILIELTTRYVAKRIGKEQTIDSTVAIYTDASGKIVKVEDRWNSKSPESSAVDGWYRRLVAEIAPRVVDVPKIQEESYDGK